MEKKPKKLPTIQELAYEMEDIQQKTSYALSVVEDLYDDVDETLKHISRYAYREERRQSKETKDFEARISDQIADMEYLTFLIDDAIRSTNQPLNDKERALLSAANVIYFQEEKNEQYCKAFNDILFTAATRPDGSLHPVVQAYTNFLSAATLNNSNQKPNAKKK